MILGPGVTTVAELHAAASPGPTKAELFRWIGVAIAVAGAILATPDGIASALHSAKRAVRKMLAFGKRLLRRQQKIVDQDSAAAAAEANLNLTGYVDKRKSWLPRADTGLKVEILHQQMEVLVQEIINLYEQTDQSGRDLRKGIEQTEERLRGEVQQLASEFQGERSQAARVDARGFGPIAIGIILTGLPDELAGVRGGGGWLGWLFVLGGTFWIVRVFPAWLRDFRKALKDRA